MDALVLARMQFAANITFHILFPIISLALGWLLLFLRWRWLGHPPRGRRAGRAGLARRLPLLDQGVRPELCTRRGQRHHHELPVRHQLAGLHGAGGNVAGPLLGYEVLTAFFLDAGFLGVMLFGHGKVIRLSHHGGHGRADAGHQLGRLGAYTWR
jgi:cytochrome d ubiquinol oxidase subunit I